METEHKDLSQELCEQINVWDMLAVIDDEDSLVEQLMPVIDRHIAAIHARYEAVAQGWMERVSEVDPFVRTVPDAVHAATLNDCASDLRWVKNQ